MFDRLGLIFTLTPELLSPDFLIRMKVSTPLSLAFTLPDLSNLESPWKYLLMIHRFAKVNGI